MTEPKAETRSLVVERTFAHPPDKIWRALTQPQLMVEWLMKNDFQPIVGHAFGFHAEWGSVACQVLEIEPCRTLSYTWAAMGLDSTVTWTLTPAGAGTHLRMEQSGFVAGQEKAFHGAKFGWQRFLENLDKVLARTD